MYKLLIIFFVSFSSILFAGNSDRAGEAGSSELLMNSDAKSAGINGINSARVSGHDAFSTNIAGIAMNKKMSLFTNYTSWLGGTETSIVNLGVIGEISEGNNLGFNFNYLNFGKIPFTTTTNPTPVGTFSPYMMNLNFAFARRFSKNVNGGLALKLINEGINNVSGMGAAIDAGLQYITGENDDIHFGVYIRNIGFPLKYNGDGLSVYSKSKGGGYDIPYNYRSAKFELPAQFSIALTKDLYFGKPYEYTCNKEHRLSLSGNFVYNAFIPNDYGFGAEYSFKEKIALRFGYLYQDDAFDKEKTLRAHMGIAGGVSLQLPLKKEKNASTVEFSYSYKPTWYFNGTHNLGISYNVGKNNGCSKYEEKIKIAEELASKPPVEVEKPKIIYKTDTIFKELPSKIEKVIEYRDVNKLFNDFAQKIEFNLARATLTQKSEGALDVIGDIMRHYPENNFKIIGHTDEMGLPENNMKLSENRAKAVAKYLVSKKSIPENNLFVEWYGEERPIASNQTDEGRAINRRVEIVLAQKGEVNNFTPISPKKFIDKVNDQNIDKKPIKNKVETKNKIKSTVSKEEIIEKPIIKEEAKTIEEKVDDVIESKPIDIKKEEVAIEKVKTEIIEKNEIETKDDFTILDTELKEDASRLLFIIGTDSLRGIAKITLKKIAASLLLGDNSFSKLTIISHTDNVKYAIDNNTISINRANIIKQYLIGKGVKESKMEVIGKGESSPISTNDTQDGRDNNNRIELILTK